MWFGPVGQPEYSTAGSSAGKVSTDLLMLSTNRFQRLWLHKKPFLPEVQLILR